MRYGNSALEAQIEFRKLHGLPHSLAYMRRLQEPGCSLTESQQKTLLKDFGSPLTWIEVYNMRMEELNDKNP